MSVSSSAGEPAPPQVQALRLPPAGVLSVCSHKTGNVIALYRPLVLLHLTRKLDAQEISLLRDIIAEGLREQIQGGMLVVFAREDLKSGLDPRARELFEQLVRRASDSVGLTAVVIASEGFAGAVVRSFFASLLHLIARRGKLKSFATVDEACDALARFHHLDGATLKAVYERAIGGGRAGAPSGSS